MEENLRSGKYQYVYKDTEIRNSCLEVARIPWGYSLSQNSKEVQISTEPKMSDLSDEESRNQKIKCQTCGIDLDQMEVEDHITNCHKCHFVINC